MTLPTQIDTNGSWEDVQSRLYECFCSTFKRTPPLEVLGKRVVFDTRTIDSDLEEGFWHVVTKGKAEDRLFDPPRARRISWIEALLTSQPEGISRWSDVHSSGATRLYFWLEAENYVVVLQERKNVLGLVTAFYVEGWGAKDLKKSRNRGTTF